MLDSYPLFAVQATMAHIKYQFSLDQQTVTKTSDYLVSSSTPKFSATRYWEYTYMVVVAGFEPATASLSERNSSRLSYTTIKNGFKVSQPHIY